jgi:DNA-binding MarR family transcriptional regulator
MTATGTAEKIEQIFEPAARAARRGDVAQIRKVLDELHRIWSRSGRKGKKARQNEDVARGMTFALEGVLGIILATAGADARRALVEGRKYALPILHALGRKARESAHAGDASSSGPHGEGASIQKGRLADIVGILPQNIGELIQAMSDCGLVTVSGKGSADHVVLTEIGAQMLEAMKPGWQGTQVEQDQISRRLDEDIQAAVQQYKAVIYSAPSTWLQCRYFGEELESLLNERKLSIASKLSGVFVMRNDHKCTYGARAGSVEALRLGQISKPGPRSKAGNQT